MDIQRDMQQMQAQAQAQAEADAIAMRLTQLRKAQSKRQQRQQVTPIGYLRLLQNDYLFHSIIDALPPTWVDNEPVPYQIYSNIHKLLGGQFDNIFTWIPNPQTRRGDGILLWKR